MSAPWKQRLMRSLHLCRSKPESRFYQLATLNTTGLPDNRTVVHRNFSQDGISLLAVTDIRSDKIVQLNRNAAFSITWYFAHTREQYRFNGMAQIWLPVPDRLSTTWGVEPDADVVRQKNIDDHWAALSPKAKAQFYWPHPKQPVSSVDQVSDPEALSPHFVVLCFLPDNVQYLDLKRTPQLRELYSLEGEQWQVQQVNA